MTFHNFVNQLFGTKEGWIYILLFCAFAFPLLQLGNAVFLRLPILNVFGSNASTILMVIAIIGALPAIAKRMKAWYVYFYIACLFVYVFQYLLFPANESYLDDGMSRFVFSALPFFFVGLLFDSKRIFKLLVVASYIMIAYRLYYDVFFNNIIEELSEYGENSEAMWQAYTTMPYVLVAFWALIKRHKIVDIIFAVLGLVLIISYGNRGSLVCIIAFVGLYLIVFQHFKRPLLAYVIIAAVVVVLLIYSQDILLGLNVLFSDLGMSTRIGDMIDDSNFFVSTERNDLIVQLIPYMKEMGFLGLGLFGTSRVLGVYSHKLHYEMWASFGYFIGTAILLTLIVLVIKTFVRCKERDSREALLFVCISGFLPLMFSFTFMIWSYFYLAIGYCVGRLDNIHLKGLNEA